MESSSCPNWLCTDSTRRITRIRAIAYSSGDLRTTVISYKYDGKHGWSTISVACSSRGSTRTAETVHLISSSQTRRSLVMAVQLSVIRRKSSKSLRPRTCLANGRSTSMGHGPSSRSEPRRGPQALALLQSGRRRQSCQMCCGYLIDLGSRVATSSSTTTSARPVASSTLSPGTLSTKAVRPKSVASYWHVPLGGIRNRAGEAGQRGQDNCDQCS